MIFLHQRQQALEESKKLSCFNVLMGLYTFAIALGGFVDMVVSAIVAFREHGNQWSLSDNTLLFGFHVDFAAVGWLVIIVTFLLVLEQSRSFGITGWEPLTSIPIWYLATYSIIIAVAVVAFQENIYFALLARYALVVWLFILVDGRRRNFLLKRKHVKAAEIEAATSTQNNPVTKTIKYCQVCQQESLYDLCVPCEKKHKNEYRRVRSQLHRARQAGVPATLTLSEWLETLETFHHRCAYCQDVPFQVIEHYIPITQGGGTTQDNCVPGCFSCNSKKSNKHPEK